MFEPPGLGLFEWKPLFRLGPVAVHKPIVLCLLVTAAVPAVLLGGVRPAA